MTEGSLHLIVKGRVQGVGFRWFVVSEARRLSLAGWVRNLADGTVEIRASGQAEALAALDKAVRKGPDGANVSDVYPAPATSDSGLSKPFSMRQD